MDGNGPFCDRDDDYINVATWFEIDAKISPQECLKRCLKITQINKIYPEGIVSDEESALSNLVKCDEDGRPLLIKETVDVLPQHWGNCCSKSFFALIEFLANEIYGQSGLAKIFKYKIIEYCADFIKELADEKNAGKSFYEDVINSRDAIFENAARKMQKDLAEIGAIGLAKKVLSESPKTKLETQNIGMVAGVDPSVRSS